MITNPDLYFHSLNDIIDFLSRNLPPSVDHAFNINECPTTTRKMPVFTCPPIKRVTFNGTTTIVWFLDDTKCVVECSKDDKYDKKTAIVYAIAKRMFGKIKEDNKTVDGNGFGSYLQKIVDQGFDQQAEEKVASERKREAKEKHLAKQKAEKKAAFDRRVKERLEQLKIEQAAKALLAGASNEDVDTLTNSKILNEASPKSKTCSCKSKTCAKHDPLDYVRPNKPFSQFTPEEKHEYWAYHNAKRRK